MSCLKKILFIPFLRGILLLSLFAPATAFAEVAEEPSLVILENNPWVQTSEGYLSKSVIGKPRGSSISFELVFLKFNPYKFKLKIRHYSEISTHSEYIGEYVDGNESAVAAINGGYFDQKGNHLGYLKLGGKTISKKVATHPIYSGIILPDQKPIIIHRDDFHPDETGDAMQVGPLLLKDGKKNPGLNNTDRIHYRSGMGYDKSGMFVIYATNTNYGGISWDDLLTILTMSDFDFQNVINLDGGGSTQLYLKKNRADTFYRGVNPIPTALVIEKASMKR